MPTRPRRTQSGTPIPESQFGTAQLFGLVGDDESVELLHAAHVAGVVGYDTAPSYGYGRSEPAVGRIRAQLDPAPLVTTKVGLLPATRPGLAARTAKAAARRLPGPLQERLRGGGGHGLGPGRFGVDAVRASVDLSLHRLGHIDRLMLHEVFPDDVTDELLGVLSAYVANGDVGAVGVATANAVTLDCLRRGPDVLTAAHVAVGPFAEAVQLPGTVTIRVGHGALGPAGSDLARISAVLDAHPVQGQRWVQLTEGTQWGGTGGLAAALLARAASSDLSTIIVATSRPDRLGGLVRAANGFAPSDADVQAGLEELITAVAEGP